tara:strand:- start:194 stop:430 length:237 start_codon:yes stop_codon:yes gene_type:complete
MGIKVGDLVTTGQANPENLLNSDNLGIVLDIIYNVTLPGVESSTMMGVAHVFWFKFNENKAGQLSCYQPVSYLIVVTA